MCRVSCVTCVCVFVCLWVCVCVGVCVVFVGGLLCCPPLGVVGRVFCVLGMWCGGVVCVVLCVVLCCWGGCCCCGVVVLVSCCVVLGVGFWWFSWSVGLVLAASCSGVGVCIAFLILAGLLYICMCVIYICMYICVWVKILPVCT